MEVNKKKTGAATLVTDTVGCHGHGPLAISKLVLRRLHNQKNKPQVSRCNFLVLSHPRFRDYPWAAIAFSRVERMSTGGGGGEP
jgi:hypothetical protein